VIGGGVPKRYVKTKSSYSWSDGSPTISGENVNGGVRIFKRGGGFQIKIPADTTDRKLKLYVGAKRVQGKVKATLSDGSAPPFETFVRQVRGKTTAEITLDYRAASVGQTLTINWTANRKYAWVGSAVSLEAVALVGSSTTSAAPVKVPSVVGMTQSDAKTAIVTARLSVGTITTASSDSVPDGEVISQTPTGGTAVSSGSAVNLTVSSGPATPLLSWVAPVSRADGTPLSLSEIAGFRVYSGLASDNLSLVADVNDGSATSHTVTGLSSGTHYFAVTTYDYSNNESVYSDIVSKTIP